MVDHRVHGVEPLLGFGGVGIRGLGQSSSAVLPKPGSIWVLTGTRPMGCPRRVPAGRRRVFRTRHVAPGARCARVPPAGAGRRNPSPTLRGCASAERAWATGDGRGDALTWIHSIRGGTGSRRCGRSACASTLSPRGGAFQETASAPLRWRSCRRSATAMTGRLGRRKRHLTRTGGNPQPSAGAGEGLDGHKNPDAIRVAGFDEGDAATRKGVQVSAMVLKGSHHVSQFGVASTAQMRCWSPIPPKCSARSLVRSGRAGSRLGRAARAAPRFADGYLQEKTSGRTRLSDPAARRR